jgi:hypothetical protein
MALVKKSVVADRIVAESTEPLLQLKPLIRGNPSDMALFLCGQQLL